MSNKTHRTFHYDSDSGKSTPVEPVKLENCDEVLVPVVLNEKGEKIDQTYPEPDHKDHRIK